MYEALYTENRGLLLHLAWKYHNACTYDRAIDMDDLTQTGFFGLVKAAASFDKTAGKPWTSWAAWYIRREMETALGIYKGRFTRPHSGALSMDAPISVTDAEGDTLGDTIPDDRLPDVDAAMLLDELRQSVRDAVNRIPDDGPRRAVWLCRLEGLSVNEAAEELKTTVTAIRLDSEKAMRVLRKDKCLKAWADSLDERTRFHAHKGVAAFASDWTSVTEAAALWRLDQKEKHLGHLANAKPQG